MCTAISYCGKRHYFGRNLDLEYHYAEQVVVTPRNYPFIFCDGTSLHQHAAMIGMATVMDGYPLYYEATNEWGLSMAGLNFPGNAVYRTMQSELHNVAPYELITWLLCRCKTVAEAEVLLRKVNVCNIAFSEKLPPSPLHWLIADKDRSIVAEPRLDGLRIYENPVGVLTNNPAFPYHMQNLANYQNLTPGQAQNGFCPEGVTQYSNGMGAIGLPGDWSSGSRFVRGSFVKQYSVSQGDEISQFFHILSSVSMPAGSVLVKGKPEITRYTCCCDTGSGIYYYTTYNNPRITAVKMRSCPLDSGNLIAFDLRDAPDIRFEN